MKPKAGRYESDIAGQGTGIDMQIRKLERTAHLQCWGGCLKLDLTPARWKPDDYSRSVAWKHFIDDTP